MDTKEILEQSIEGHQAAIDKAQEQLDALEVTYSIADRFKNDRHGDKAILIQCEGHTVVIACLREGNRYSRPVQVKDPCKITQDEYKRITGTYTTFTRYFDCRRGKKMNEKQILKQSIESHQVAIDKAARSKLAAIAAPELRHGDYGLSEEGGHPRLYVYDNGIRWANKSYLEDHECTPGNLILGNIFADLASQAEPLEEFVRPIGHNNTFGMKINGDCIDYHGDTYCSFVLDEAIKIHCKFGRLIAELKRKAAQ